MHTNTIQKRDCRDNPDLHKVTQLFSVGRETLRLCHSTFTMPICEARNDKPVFPLGSTFSDMPLSEKSPRGCVTLLHHFIISCLCSTQMPTNDGEGYTAPQDTARHSSGGVQRPGKDAWGGGVRALPCKGCPAAGPAPQLCLH